MIIKATLQAILVTTAAYLSFPAMAAAGDANPNTPGLTKQEASDLKTESKAEYKARKKVTDAQKDLDVADCKTAGLESKDERDCKKDAKDSAKASKKHAKEVYKEEKADIKANTQ
jgi:hypothetical protein